MIPEVPLFGTQHCKGKNWLFLKNKDRTNNVMDKIWDRNPLKSEVIAYCGGDEKNEWPRRTDKSRTLKIKLKKLLSKIREKFWLINAPSAIRQVNS